METKSGAVSKVASAIILLHSSRLNRLYIRADSIRSYGKRFDSSVLLLEQPQAFLFISATTVYAWQQRLCVRHPLQELP